MIYASRHYYVDVAGATSKTVVCEKCGSTFHYEVERTGRGEGQSPFFLDNAGSEERARREAEQSLRGRLERAVEPVPCPDCDWLQTEMVTELRRRSHRGLLWIGIAVPAVLAVILWMTVFLGTDFFKQDLSSENKRLAASLAGALVTSVLLGLGSRWRLVRRIDPNRRWRPPAFANTTRDNRKADSSPLPYAEPDIPGHRGQRPAALLPAILLGSGLVCWLIAVGGMVASFHVVDDRVTAPLVVGGLVAGFLPVFIGMKALRARGY
jgi:hypothetical protein